MHSTITLKFQIIIEIKLIRQNSLLNQANREKVMKYEQSLHSAHRNRLKLQQQSYESEIEYYKRLREIEGKKLTQFCIKNSLLMRLIKKIKTNLDKLYSDVLFKEDVLKNLNNE